MKRFENFLAAALAGNSSDPMLKCTEVVEAAWEMATQMEAKLNEQEAIRVLGNGLVVTDMGGGDYCYSLVDGELWAQICDLRENMSNNEKWEECVLYLTSFIPEPRPYGCPTRAGRLLTTFYPNAHVIEKLDEPINNIIGVLYI